MGNFVYPGALTADERYYIGRDADRDVAEALQFGRFIHLAEPRQQGKTSLINHLSKRPELERRFILDVPASSFRGRTPDEWYRVIGGAILRRLRQYLSAVPQAFGAADLPSAPNGANDWHPFLEDLALQAKNYLIVAIDEIDVVQFEGSDQFYSVIKNIRDLPGSRLAFLLSGCFHPSSLIQDDRCSPFNAASRVEIPDFTLEEVRELAGRGGLENRSGTVERMYYWTDGHPAITQYLCSQLTKDSVVTDVDNAVDHFIQHDVSNLPRIKYTLEHRPALRSGFADILSGQRHFLHEYDFESVDARLRLAGLIKRGRNNNLVVRNRIYAEVFKPEAARYQVFLSYRRTNSGSAVLLKEKLDSRNVRTYFDEISLQPGDPYPERLLEAIKSAPCFVLLLNQGDLARCSEPGDWMYREIKQALDVGANIIPVVVPPSSHPRPEDLPEEIRALCDRQAIEYTPTDFDRAAEAIRNRCER